MWPPLPGDHRGGNLTRDSLRGSGFSYKLPFGGGPKGTGFQEGLPERRPK